MNSLLQEAATQPSDVECWYGVPTGRLVQRLLDTHLRWVHEELPWIEELLDSLDSGQGSACSRRLRRAFNRLRFEMVEHLRKEENVLFPAILELERCSAAELVPPRPPFGAINNPILMMEQDHETDTRLWEELRAVTQDYTVPAQASELLRVLYQELQAFEAEVRAHTCLENRILFPRARRLEQEGRRPRVCQKPG